MSWFVAFPISAGAWFDALEPPPGLRKEHAIDLHLTVAFFGDVEEARARAAFELTRQWPSTISSGTLGSLVPLGNPRHPSVVAVTLNNPELAELMSVHRDALYDAAGVERDQRSALPHATVARFGRRASSAERAAGLAWAEKTRVDATVTIGPVALYGSARSPDRKYVYSR